MRLEYTVKTGDNNAVWEYARRVEEIEAARPKTSYPFVDKYMKQG